MTESTVRRVARIPRRSFEIRGYAWWICVVSGLLSSGCTGATPTETVPVVTRPAESKSKPTRVSAKIDPQQLDLPQALAAVSSGRFQVAEGALRRIIEQDPEAAPRAQIALAEIELMTGRRERALDRSLPSCRPQDPLAIEACAVAAEVLRRGGAVDDAIRLLLPFADAVGFRRLRLGLADLLSDRGRIGEARALYRRLVDDFTEGRLAEGDARDQAIAGRAAHRLGAWREANELFNRVDLTGLADLSTLVWRGELYLDAHDRDRAGALADEAIRFAPEHPSALLLAARVRLSALREGQIAEHHLQRVLAIDPTRGDAYAILGGLALHDLDFARVKLYIDQGLEKEPRHLELLSLRAAARFLADDQQGFDAAVSDVLRQNPSHARVYRLVAEYAEAEHRYDETIPLLRRAIELDREDSVVRAQLGIQLLRSGEEAEGRKHLVQAFAKDPFDLRVKNTLTLYERKVDKEYSTIRHGQFAILVPNANRAVLGAIVPDWLDRARSVLQKRYGNLQARTIFVELYADQDSFGVRTSGVPATFLQGTCFGRTIVARLPTDEPTNLGMTLWHELSHVYHLQLSRHRVPRWFTEGLAELETARHRPEWSREYDIAVYEALRKGRLPAVERMNRAFSHAASLEDLAVAYVASTYLVEYLLHTYGDDRLTTMLRVFGQRKSTEEVVSQVLGTDLTQLDAAYRDALHKRLAHFESQYFPPDPPNSVETARAALTAHPEDPTARAALAHTELVRGQLSTARQIIDLAPPNLAHHADLLWVESMLALAEKDPQTAERALGQMISDGHDGYFVRMQLALVARFFGDAARERAELTRGRDYHPTAAEPLYRLAAIARESGDHRAELLAMAKLARIEESDVHIHRRVVELYLELGQLEDARVAAEALSYVNLLDADARRLLARVALANRDRKGALRELGYARWLTPQGSERDRIDRILTDVAAGRPIDPSKTSSERQ
jgi:cellulose synthase operon protein C